MLTESIKLVIFDMAGTTVYDDHYVTSALCQALQGFGFTVPLQAADEVMGIAKPVAIRMLLNRFYAESVETTPIEEIHAAFLKLMISFYETSPEIREIEGTSQVFRTLKDQGIKIGIDTGFSRDITDIIINRLGWYHEGLLDVTVASDEVDHGRPAPDMVFRAMELAGITDPKSVVKVGDTPVDILEGSNAGCGMVIGVLSGVSKREDLYGYDDVILLESILDIPNIIRDYIPVYS